MKATLETRGVQTGKLAPGIDSWVVWEDSSLMVGEGHLGLSLTPWFFVSPRRLIISEPCEELPTPHFLQASRMGRQMRFSTSAVLLEGQEPYCCVSLALFLHGRPPSEARSGLELEE